MIKQEVLIEIRGNKYTEDEIDTMLNDYINIGENLCKKRVRVVENLLKAFIKKYKKNGFDILNKKRDLKQFLNSAKSIYRLAEFYLCSKQYINYNKYIYLLNRNLKGTKVYLCIKKEKEVQIVFTSLPNFIEHWFIYKKIGGIQFGKEE